MSGFENIEYIKDEAERIGAQVADAYNDGLMNNLKKADTEVVKAFNTRYEAINYQLQYGLISEEEYYKKLEKARDSYFSRDTQEWHKYTAEIFEHRQSTLEEYRQFVSDGLDELLKITEKGREEFSKIEAQEGAYKEKLIGYAGSPTGFDTHVTYVDNYWPTGDPLKMVDYTLVDYDAEIQKLSSFNDSINALKERAADIDPEIFKMYFDDIRNMSVDDAKILTDLLLKASDEDFEKQFELYAQRNELAENMATSYYYDDYDQMYQDIRTELQHAFVDMPLEFLKYSEIIGQGIADGFVNEVNDFYDDIRVEMPYVETTTQNTSNVQNTEFSPIYYFYGERGSTSRTRLNAKNDALFSYMRGLS